MRWSGQGCLLGILLIIAFSSMAEGTEYTCSSCLDCSSKLQVAASGDSVSLTTDIQSDSGNACIDFGTSSGVLFDGQGHGLSRGTSGHYGIYLGSATCTGNSVEQVEVSGFSRGIYLVYASGNTIRNSLVRGNNSGIEFYSASSNVIEDNRISQNGIGVYLEYNSDSNIIRRSSITGNHESGITFFPRLSAGDPENNEIYDNILSNTANGNVNITAISTEVERDLSSIPFIFNNPLVCGQGANIMGCGCTGGNYWELPLEQGFSQTCADVDGNGICDAAYAIPHDTAILVDNYPLAVPPGGCCVDDDRDRDGYHSSLCGGDDHDDDPLSCGAACYPGGEEVCDGYDNDGDMLEDGTIACRDMLLYRKTLLERPVADQSCAADPAAGKIYCFGGRTYGGPGYLDEIVVYNMKEDSLDVLEQHLPTPRSDLSCTYAPGTARIFCFGGYRQETICTHWDENGGCISAYSIIYRYNDIIEFDPADESLVMLPVSLPDIMDGMSSIWNSRTQSIFVLGGTSQIHAGNSDAILEFDPVGRTLATRAAHLPSARFDHSCAADSQTGNVYCFGGYGADGGLAEIVEFNPDTDNVVVKNAAFPEGIYDSSCVEDSVDQLIYCLAGKSGNSGYRGDIFVYNPAQDFLQEQEARFISGRYGHSCTENPATNRIYCFGGSQNVVKISEISQYTPYLPMLGDINDSETLDLTDLLLSLRQMTGYSGSEVNRKADVGGNRQLGLEEALYVIRAVAR